MFFHIHAYLSTKVQARQAPLKLMMEVNGRYTSGTHLGVLIVVAEVTSLGDPVRLGLRQRERGSWLTELEGGFALDCV